MRIPAALLLVLVPSAVLAQAPKPLDKPFPRPPGRMLDLKNGVNVVDINGDGIDDWIVLSSDYRNSYLSGGHVQFFVWWPEALNLDVNNTPDPSKRDFLKVGVEIANPSDRAKYDFNHLALTKSRSHEKCAQDDVRVFLDDGFRSYFEDGRSIDVTGRSRLNVIWAHRERHSCDPSRTDLRLYSLQDLRLEENGDAAKLTKDSPYPPWNGYQPTTYLVQVGLYKTRRHYTNARIAIADTLKIDIPPTADD